MKHKILNLKTQLLSSVVLGACLLAGPGYAYQNQNFDPEIDGLSGKNVRTNWLAQHHRGLLQNTSIPGDEISQPQIKRSKATTIRNSFFSTAALPFSAIQSRQEWQRVSLAALQGGAITGCHNPDLCDILSDETTFEDADHDAVSFYEKLTLVNSLVNQFLIYEEDDVQYNQLDYWATASQTLQSGRGDCEDFAILKYALLRKLGIPAESLSLVVLKDNDRGLYHAVLAVSTNNGHFILDNLYNNVYRDISVPHYQPLYSFSLEHSWIHGKPKLTADLAREGILDGELDAGFKAGFNGGIEPIGLAKISAIQPVALQ